MLPEPSNVSHGPGGFWKSSHREWGWPSVNVLAFLNIQESKTKPIAFQTLFLPNRARNPAWLHCFLLGVTLCVEVHDCWLATSRAEWNRGKFMSQSFCLPMLEWVAFLELSWARFTRLVSTMLWFSFLMLSKSGTKALNEQNSFVSLEYSCLFTNMFRHTLGLALLYKLQCAFCLHVSKLYEKLYKCTTGSYFKF